MKIKIGKYTNWIGPYQVMDWFAPIVGADRIEKFTSGKFFEKWSDKSMPFFNWIESKKKRKIKIKIDKYDSWNVDHTLSLIIVPLLIQLKETTRSSPISTNDDVPEHLHSTMDKDGNDEFMHERWEWILDEIIWAFTQVRDDKWEEQFHSGVHDIQWKAIPAEEIAKMKADDPDMFKDINGDEESTEDLMEMAIGPKDTHKFDKEGYNKYADRITNGHRLFGKYFWNMWD